jgi:gliding motility-associated-like protein
MITYRYLLLSLFFPIFLNAEKTDPLPATTSEVLYGQSHYLFEENKGQFPKQVFFRADMGSKKLWLEEDGLFWHFVDEEAMAEANGCRHGSSCDHQDHTAIQIDNHAFRIRFAGGQKVHSASGVDSSAFYENYIKGQNPEAWAQYVRSYKQARLQQIYPGIDFHIYQYEDRLKYDFILEAGKNPEQIKLEFKGVDNLFLKDGDLYVCTSVDTLIERAPLAYQNQGGFRKDIQTEFVLDGHTVSFRLLEDFDPSRPLILDPELVFSSYSGSSADNWGMTATPGLNDELFAGGIVFGEGFYPTTTGAFQTSFLGFAELGVCDIAISRFSADGSRLEYSTYMGGRDSDVPHSLIINSRGELVIYGSTSSQDFPTTVGAFDPNFNGGVPLDGIQNFPINGIPYYNGVDIFVAVLNPQGTNLIGSTYVGGSANDGVNYNLLLPYNYGDQLRGEVIVGPNDQIYVASSTQSGNFPTSNTAFRRNPAGRQDAVVFSLDRRCRTLVFSTYLGGNNEDAAYAIKRARDGNLYVAGGTASRNFPVTPGSAFPAYGGNIDGFVTRLNANGTAISASSFVGRGAYDQAYLLALDFNGEVYIAGQSENGMPITPNVYANPNSGQFLIKLNESLNAIEAGTQFGSGKTTVDISLTALMVDTCRRVFVSGWGGITNNSGGIIETSSTEGLPITADAFQDDTDGSDFYFIVLDPDFTDLVYGSYFGRSDLFSRSNDHVDGGTSRFSSKGVIYQAVCAGCGGFSDFPTTPGAWSERNGSNNCNLAAIKFDFQLSQLIAAADLELDTFGCAPYEAEFINQSIGANQFFWDFGDGSTSTEENPSHLYENVGTYEVTLIASSDESCLDPDTLYITIETILAEPPKTIDTLVCGEESVILSASRQTPNSTYFWSRGQRTRNVVAVESGIYAVTATESNCLFVDSINLTLINPEIRLTDQVLCGEESTVLRIDDRSADVVWSTGESGTSITVTENDVYTVTYRIDACAFEDSAAIQFPSIPEVEILGPDEACEGEAVTLEVNNLSPSTIIDYDWSNGRNEESINISQTGTYVLTVTSDSSCTYTTEKFVFIIPNLPEIDVPDTLLCADSQFEVDLSFYDTIAQILWDDGSTMPVRTFLRKGSFGFDIVTDCQLIEDDFTVDFSPFGSDDQPVYIPNTFTPNGDQINDIFRVERAQEMVINDFLFEVFDRWGNRLFQATDIEQGWDGTFKGTTLEEGSYTYTMKLDYFICEGSQKIERRGDITLVR